MKRFLTLAALAFALLTASAQREPKLTIKAGVGLSSVVGADANTKVKIAAKVGVAYDLRLYKGLYVIPELDFALKGFNPDGVNLITRDKVVHMAYLQAPIMVGYKFRLKNNGNIVVKAGPYFAYGLCGSKFDSNGYYYVGEINVFDSEYGARRFDTGIAAGLAFERDHFTIGLEYSRGLHRLDPDFRQFNQSFGITLGCRL